jgi:hypothetical protein
MPVGFRQDPLADGDQPSPVIAPSDSAGDEGGVLDEFAERPELFVGAAFAGGLALALVVRVLGR